MSFSKINNFILLATKKYKLENLSIASLICEKSRQIISKNFPENDWEVKKFQNGKLYLSVRNSASSAELFLKTNEIIELISSEGLPAKIESICITKN